MEKAKSICWADFSDDEGSDEEDPSTQVGLGKNLLVETIKTSALSMFHLKVENLPYKISSNEEIHSFLGVSSAEAVIRMQHKGSKFIGSALITAKTQAAAIKIALKNEMLFNGRAILVSFKPSETTSWVPHKRNLINNSISREILSLVSPKGKATQRFEFNTPKNPIKACRNMTGSIVMDKDSAIIRALPKLNGRKPHSQIKFTFN